LLRTRVFSVFGAILLRIGMPLTGGISGFLFVAGGRFAFLAGEEILAEYLACAVSFIDGIPAKTGMSALPFVKESTAYPGVNCANS
jgi:hypothetical protein